MKTYSEQQKTIFVELAQEVGIGRAIRELHYPSYPAALAWCKQRGVQPNVDELMQNVKKYHTFYETEDLRVVLEESIAVGHDLLLSGELDADGYKKVTEGLQKATNTLQLLQGKATAISETHSKDATDLELIDLLNVEKAKAAMTSRDLDTALVEA